MKEDTDQGSLVHAGCAGSEQPKRFYKFALIDPVDKPFATFRYFYRTWAQLQELGLSEREVVEDGESNHLPIIEPHDGDDLQSNRAVGPKDATQRGDKNIRPSHDGGNDRSSSPFETYISTASPSRCTTEFHERPADQKRASSQLGSSRSYRLSVPPSCQLDPPEHSQRPMPAIPQKHHPDSMEDTSYQPHPAYPINDWEMRTPSPVQSLRETISTPTMDRRTKRGLTPTGWLGMIGNAWRRRGTPSNLSSDDGSRAASCSDSRGVR